MPTLALPGKMTTRHIRAWILTGIFVWSVTSDARASPPPPPRPLNVDKPPPSPGKTTTRDPRRDAQPGEKYALLVGVRNYDKNELRNLPYSEPDVTELADLLRNAGYQRVTLLTQTRGAEDARFLPTAENIRKSLKGLLRDKDKDDNVMVAFAGHGVQFRGSDEHYFCPMDAKLGDKKTLVGLNEVYEQMKGSEAGFKLLLADACRNDPQSDSSRSLSPVKLETVLRPQRRKPPGGVEAFFSCSEGQKAYESADLKHGIFFHFVLEGLKGGADYDRDGDVDLDELLKYTKKKVRDKVQDEFGEDVEQVPQGVGDIEGVVPLIHYERLRTTRD